MEESGNDDQLWRYEVEEPEEKEKSRIMVTRKRSLLAIGQNVDAEGCQPASRQNLN